MITQEFRDLDLKKFKSFYYNHSNNEIYKEFNITEKDLYKIINIYNIPKRNTAKNNITISKQALKQFYILENHTLKETLTYFNTTRSILTKKLKQFNLKKDQSLKLTDYIKMIDKQEFITYYKNNSLNSCLKHFNINNTKMFYKLIAYYGQTKNTSLKAILKIINKKDFVDYFLTHTNKETCIYFNISDAIFKKLKKEYKLNTKHTTTKTLSNYITKEELFKYFIEENHTMPETLTYFKNKQAKTNFGNLAGLLKYYKINKKEYSKNKINDLLLKSENKLTLHQIANELNLNYINTTHLIKTLKLENKINYTINTSTYELELRDFISSLGLTYIANDKTVLNGQEIDIYIPSVKLGIEFNGNYWHSSLFREKNYHLNKAKLAKEKNIRLIQIREYEWLNKNTRQILESIIKVAANKTTTKIYARNCSIKKITNSEAKIFNNYNHLQGHRNAQITYGLYYKNTLVQLMSFSHTKYNKNLKNTTEWEIIRGCPGSNNLVIGGVSKLLSHFIRENKPTKIFSYCDFNKFNGKSYEASKMKFIGYTGPNLKWLMRDGTVIDRNPKNHNILSANSITKIWQAGALKYELKLS